MAHRKYPTFQESTIEAVAEVLGDTAIGLTNKDIAMLLASTGILDPLKAAQDSDPRVRAGLAYVPMSKRDRIRRALADNQARTGTGNALIAFVAAAMSPQRYLDRKDLFDERSRSLNIALSFEGLRVNEEGKVSRAHVARTLTEAEVLAGRLQAELTRRSAHPEAVRYCTVELLAQDNFHAALEAMKGIADRIRTVTGVDSDGAELVQRVFSLKTGRPLIAVNRLQTESERSEQTGFSNLVTGLFGLYRNPTAHDPRIERDATRPIGEVELLELLTTVSLVHHVLDRADQLKT